MIEYILFCVLLMNFCWVYFTAIMRLQEIHKSGVLNTQNRVLWILSMVNLAIGLVLDVAVNWFVVTIILLELPAEFLTTARLCRWYETPEPSWRKSVAAWFGEILLDPIDTSGKHVK